MPRPVRPLSDIFIPFSIFVESFLFFHYFPEFVRTAGQWKFYEINFIGESIDERNGDGLQRSIRDRILPRSIAVKQIILYSHSRITIT
jgi:hypothetical protein